MIKEKKIPERRCLGCGEHFPKRDLVRVLRRPDGEIVLDLTGKLSGRGAYVCNKLACLTRARKSKRLEASLECSIPDTVYADMEAKIGSPRE